MWKGRGQPSQIGASITGEISADEATDLLPLLVLALTAESKTMCTQGEKCMLDLIKLFNKYASEDGDKNHLSKKEGKALLQKEFCHFIDETANKEVVEEIMTSLDFNSDGKMDFQEFMSLIVMMAPLCKLYRCPK